MTQLLYNLNEWHGVPMNWSAEKKIEHLIGQYFRWGESGYPDRPEGQSSVDIRRRVEAWVTQKVKSLGLEPTAVALCSRILSVIEDVASILPPDEQPRHFSRPDFSHLVKSPASILDKMARDWDPDKSPAPRLGFDNFLEQVDDLARFRIVLNFLSDVDVVCRRLEEPYACKAQDLPQVSPAQRSLHEEFILRDNRLHDFIQLKPKERGNGERCRKGLFLLRRNPQLKVEVQVQTMLQEAWDKKDHFLIYEPRRRGDPVDESHEIEIYAMSELLYVADLTFDRLLTDIRQRREGHQ